MNPRFLGVDFESRSPVDLKEYSTTRYASHPETDILCIGLKWQGRPASALTPKKGQFVLDGTIRPIELMHAIEHNIPIVVHNLSFEKRMYHHICVKRWGWPPIPDHLWIDTAAICRYYAIPARLVEACKALGLEAQKDMAGNRVMLQLSKPRKPRKKEVQDWLALHDNLQMPTLWWEDEEKLARVVEYCKLDVVAQEHLLLKLGKLPPEREAEWRFDEMVNERGVPLDWGSLVTTLDVVDQSLAGFNQRLQALTSSPAYPDGVVSSVTQRKKILDWCDLQGWSMISTNKASVEDALNSSGCPAHVKEVLQIVQDAGKSSLGKLETMVNLCDDDWRVRDTTAWHGAATGRKAGRGIQPQNFPNKCMNQKEAEKFFGLLREKDPFTALDTTYCNPQWVGNDARSMPDLVSSALRGYIKAEDGRLLFVSDFSTIEARNLAWMADCKALLSAFAAKKCVYRQFAGRIYNLNREASEALDKNSMERKLGKVSVLGLGYGMGHAKFKDTAAAPPNFIELPEDRAKEIVKLYRETYPEVPAFWRACEEAFLEAIRNKTQVQMGKVAFGCNGEWGWIVLPSGRCIWMREPKVDRVPDRWREGKTRLQITYYGIDSKTKQWCRRHTYGGSLCESICQAIAADLLQAALHRLEANGYPVIVSVHDEVVCEVDENANFDRFHNLMKERPAWAHDLPIECESEKGKRYGK